jgi:hypothetical protein
LEKQRQYDRERGRKYCEEHKEERNQKKKEWVQQNTERLSEKHVCEVCGGTYTMHHMKQHFRTKRHQHAAAHLANS